MDFIILCGQFIIATCTACLCAAMLTGVYKSIKKALKDK